VTPNEIIYHRRVRVMERARTTSVSERMPDVRGEPHGSCHFAARPGDLVALDSFYIGRLRGVGNVWQLTAVDPRHRRTTRRHGRRGQQSRCC
jgi:hypothetical protein